MQLNKTLNIDLCDSPSSKRCVH